MKFHVRKLMLTLSLSVFMVQKVLPILRLMIRLILKVVCSLQLLKFLPNEVRQAILIAWSAENGDLIFFGADSYKVVSEALGALRCKLGEDLDLYTCEWAPLWVVDFPMFEEIEGGALTSLHHPFTAPSCKPEELESNPAESLSRAYDMVLNGTELGGGSVRIHNQDMQQAVFRVLALMKKSSVRSLVSY